MARICDICGEKIGWKAFHCQDGAICKRCYQIVSNHFTSTITQKKLAELKHTYRRNAAPLNLGEDGFLASRTVGAFLLLDEQRRKFCLPGNRSGNGQYARPEIYSFENLDGYMLVSDPELPAEQLAALPEARKERLVVRRLAIRLRIAGAGIRELVVLPSPVRSSSFAFRRSYRVARDIMQELQYINQT